MAMPPLPYTVQQVADQYGYSVDKIRREIREGRLPARHKRGQSRIYYMTDKDIKDWIDNMLEDA